MSNRSDQYPRVLIIGHDFAPNTGDQATLSSLFKGWPRDRIAVAAQSRAIGTSGFAGHYYRFGVLEDRWVWPLSLIPREPWKISGPTAPAVAPGPEETPIPMVEDASGSPGSAEPAGSWLRHGGSAVLSATGAQELLRGLHLSDRFRQWLAEYQPDVIYTQLSSLRLVRLAKELLQDTGVPLVIHFMDDWPSTVYRRTLLGPILRSRLLPELEELIHQAAVLMAISDEMSREFEKRYGRGFHTYHNAVDLGEWKQARRTSWEAREPLEVLYAGRIGTVNISSLLDVAQAVESLTQSGLGVRLTILSQDAGSPSASPLKGLPHVDVLPAIPHAGIPARLAAADILVLPLDFGEKAERFARFSMPSKTSEYMASGTPTVVYAPARNAVSRYATAEGWGRVVGKRSTRELTVALRSLAESAQERERLGRRAADLAFAHHDAHVVGEAFRRDLESAAATRAAAPTAATARQRRQEP